MNIIKALILPAVGFGLCCANPAMAEDRKESSWGFGGSSKKEQPAKTETSPLPWIVNCASNGAAVNCVASQQLYIQKTRQLLLGITVRVPPKDDNGVMMIQLPHGLHLPDCVVLKVDEGSEEKHPVQTCNPQGCYVGFTIKSAMLKQMKSGKVMNVTFKNLNKADVKIGVPLTGFDQAFEKIKS